MLKIIESTFSSSKIESDSIIKLFEQAKKYPHYESKQYLNIIYLNIARLNINSDAKDKLFKGEHFSKNIVIKNNNSKKSVNESTELKNVKNIYEYKKYLLSKLAFKPISTVAKNLNVTEYEIKLICSENLIAYDELKTLSKEQLEKVLEILDSKIEKLFKNATAKINIPRVVKAITNKDKKQLERLANGESLGVKIIPRGFYR